MALMNEVEKIFFDISVSDLVRTGLVPDKAYATKLNYEEKNLALFFRKYFDSFKDLISYAEVFDKHFNIFLPVRVVPSDIGFFIT